MSMNWNELYTTALRNQEYQCTSFLRRGRRCAQALGHFAVSVTANHPANQATGKLTRRFSDKVTEQSLPSPHCGFTYRLLNDAGRSFGKTHNIHRKTSWCSCLENPMDRGAWRTTAHEVVRVGHNWATKRWRRVLKSRKVSLQQWRCIWFGDSF